MLEKLLRARLPEQIVALIENLEQNPDTSHLDKVGRFLDFYSLDITRFERWVIKRALTKVRGVVRRDALLRDAMSIVINAPEETFDANTYTYKMHGRYLSTGLGQNTVVSAQELQDMAQKAQQAQNTWFDAKSLTSASNRLY
jgi:hypothetical protein